MDFSFVDSPGSTAHRNVLTSYHSVLAEVPWLITAYVSPPGDDLLDSGVMVPVGLCRQASQYTNSEVRRKPTFGEGKDPQDDVPGPF